MTVVDNDRDSAAAVAGLDALDTPVERTTPWWQRFLRTWLPPLVALALIVLVWQIVWASAITPEYKLPAPGAVARRSARRSPAARSGPSCGPRSAGLRSASCSPW